MATALPEVFTDSGARQRAEVFDVIFHPVHVGSPLPEGGQYPRLVLHRLFEAPGSADRVAFRYVNRVGWMSTILAYRELREAKTKINEAEMAKRLTARTAAYLGSVSRLDQALASTPDQWTTCNVRLAAPLPETFFMGDLFRQLMGEAINHLTVGGNTLPDGTRVASIGFSAEQDARLQHRPTGALPILKGLFPALTVDFS